MGLVSIGTCTIFVPLPESAKHFLRARANQDSDSKEYDRYRSSWCNLAINS